MTKLSELNLGATGKFPKGKLNKNDEGELKMAIGNRNGNVEIHFGTTVAWLGFPPEDALELAALLIKNAHLAMKKSNDTN